MEVQKAALRRGKPLFSINRRSSRGLPPGGEALAAVNGPVVFGNEWDARRRAASSAGGLEHLARLAVVGTAGLAGLPALLAAGRLILEALFGIKLLLTGGEHEFGATVLAHHRLVLVHRLSPPE